MEKWAKGELSYLHDMDKNLTITQLADDGGAHILHTRYKMGGLMGLMVSDRSFYTAEWEDGDKLSHATISTTEGNKHIEEANKKTTGKDVLGTVHVEYFKTTIDSTGVVRFLQAKQAHAGGNLPRGLNLPTKEILEEIRGEIEGMIDYIVNKMK